MEEGDDKHAFRLCRAPVPSNAIDEFNPHFILKAIRYTAYILLVHDNKQHAHSHTYCWYMIAACHTRDTVGSEAAHRIQGYPSMIIGPDYQSHSLAGLVVMLYRDLGYTPK